MTSQERFEFIENIKEKVNNDISLFPEIVSACNSVIMDTIEDHREQIINMETIAIALAGLIDNKRYKASHDNWLRRLLSNKIKNIKTAYFPDWKDVVEKIDSNP
jgi:hypothetical protein